MVYPSDDRHLRAHILAQRSREIRRLAAARQAAPAEVMRVIGELIREAEALLRDYPSPGGRGGGRTHNGPQRLPPERAPP